MMSKAYSSSARTLALPAIFSGMNASGSISAHTISPCNPFVRRQEMGSSFNHISRAISEELKDPRDARSSSSEDTEDADGDEGPAPPDFWAEVREEAKAMMAEQLDAEMAVAREEGLHAAKQELEVPLPHLLFCKTASPAGA